MLPFSRRSVCVFLLPLLAAPAYAADDVIRFTPDQVNRAGVVASTLADMKAGGADRLPAQVVVPPSQIEVMAAPLPALVGAVSVAYGETVKKGQLLARLRGAQLLELQRDFAMDWCGCGNGCSAAISELRGTSVIWDRNQAFSAFISLCFFMILVITPFSTSPGAEFFQSL